LSCDISYNWVGLFTSLRPRFFIGFLRGSKTTNFLIKSKKSFANEAKALAFMASVTPLRCHLFQYNDIQMIRN
jgi:hypothetical protein